VRDSAPQGFGEGQATNLAESSEKQYVSVTVDEPGCRTIDSGVDRLAPLRPDLSADIEPGVRSRIRAIPEQMRSGVC